MKWQILNVFVTGNNSHLKTMFFPIFVGIKQYKGLWIKFVLSYETCVVQKKIKTHFNKSIYV